MASVLSQHQPIGVVSTLSGNQEKIFSYLEGSGQTFQPGTPVQKATSGGNSGFIVASTPSNGSTAVIVLGVSALVGKNLGTPGAGASPLFGSIGYPGGLGAVQNIQNQPAAFSIYHGAPFVDGLTLTYVATLDTIFEIQVDNSAGSGTLNATTALIGSTIGLNIDSSGDWYADLAHVNNSSYADVNVVGINPLDLVVGSTTAQQNFGRIWVVFNTAVIQGLQ